MADVTKLTGEQFRSWTLERELGRGDSAIVYAARQNAKRAAIKIFFPEALGRHGFSEETQRLELQLRLQGRKHHPNLVEIYEGGSAPDLGNTLFISMELVPGNTLDKIA
jgi:eukaryotic-like serine/threonine-protein kinase